jgi:hypothetical protein
VPRIQRVIEEPRVHEPDIVAALVEELRSSHSTGQPRIEETVFPRTNRMRITVIWDRWERIPDEERTACILRAYDEVEGPAFRERIALAIGLTVPEAHQCGLLPFHVEPALRRGDPFTLEQCREAMIRQGASVLEDEKAPQLRFATVQEAENCVRQLGETLPGSEAVWMIARDPQPT